MPVALAMSTPVTLAAVSYIQRSPGWYTSGSRPSRRIHSSDEDGSSPSSASAIGISPGSAGITPGAEGAGQQIPQGDRAIRRNGVLQRPVGIGEHGHLRELGEEVVDPVVETEGAVLHERHRTRRDDRFRHGAHATDRVGRHRRCRPDTVERKSARRLDMDVAVAGQDRHHTGNDAGVDKTTEPLPDPGQSFGRKASHSHLPPFISGAIARCGFRDARALRGGAVVGAGDRGDVMCVRWQG